MTAQLVQPNIVRLLVAQAVLRPLSGSVLRWPIGGSAVCVPDSRGTSARV
jgi:hypothetical protein